MSKLSLVLVEMQSKETKGHNVDEGGWTKVRQRKHGKDNKITSFYVSNIKQDTIVDMLYETFHEYGSLADIYILGREKSGSYFTFVKYEGVRDALEMENRLNNAR
ncbi:hypothetical protein Lser_V15G07918 [Lactuca serriola]